MIYLIQPLFFKNNNIYKIIKNILCKHPLITTKKISHLQLKQIKPNKNVYFIIDRKIPLMDGLSIAKKIREKDNTSHIIMITNDLNYKKYYRSHITFLAILELGNPQLYEELEDILNYILTS